MGRSWSCFCLLYVAVFRSSSELSVCRNLIQKIVLFACWIVRPTINMKKITLEEAKLLGLKTCLSDCIRACTNSIAIGEVDRDAYVACLGDYAVSVIESYAEVMPPNTGATIQCGLNISYNKGFSDACNMLLRMLNTIGEMVGVEL